MTARDHDPTRPDDSRSRLVRAGLLETVKLETEEQVRAEMRRVQDKQDKTYSYSQEGRDLADYYGKLYEKLHRLKEERKIDQRRAAKTTRTTKTAPPDGGHV